MKEAIFRSVIEKVDHGLIVMDHEAHFIIWNRAAVKILGLQHELTDRDSWMKYFNIYHMDGSMFEKDDYPSTRALNGNEVIKDYMKIVALDNTRECILEVDAYPIYKDDVIVAAFVSFMDVTNQVILRKLYMDINEGIGRIGEIIGSNLHKSFQHR